MIKPLVIVLSGFLLTACAHDERAMQPPSAAAIDADRLAKISYYEQANADRFLAECVQKGKWRFLSCHLEAGHLTTFPGLAQPEIKQYIDSGLIEYECIDHYGMMDGIFGESLALRTRLRETREAYAERVNRAVLEAIRKHGLVPAA